MSSQITISPARKRTRGPLAKKSKKTKATRTSWQFTKSVGKLGKGFPDKCTITHRYVEDQVVSMAANSIARVTYKCNGLYDPTDAAGGHQPLFYDQMTPIYDHYAVVRSRIKATFSQPYQNENVAAGGPGPIHCCVYTDDDTSGSATWTTVLESADKLAWRTLDVGGPAVTLYTKWSPARTFGSKPLENPRLQGTSAADPTELTHFHVCAYNTLALAGTRYCNVTVEIEYDTVWFELKTPTGS